MIVVSLIELNKRRLTPQHVSNVWDEYRDWLYMDADNVDPILALVADTLTQNVFFIVKDPPKTTLTAQVLKSFGKTAVLLFPCILSGIT